MSETENTKPDAEGEQRESKFIERVELEVGKGAFDGHGLNAAIERVYWHMSDSKEYSILKDYRAVFVSVEYRNTSHLKDRDALYVFDIFECEKSGDE